MWSRSQLDYSQAGPLQPKRPRRPGSASCVATALLLLVGGLLSFLIIGRVREERTHRAQVAELQAREVQYWEEWIRNKGFEYWTRMSNRELEDDIKWLIPRTFLRSKQTIRVLDAGAGPVTQLGSVWPGRDLELHACDALADRYDALLQKYDLDPPVRTVAAQLEAVDRVYPREYFHFVLARDVIDQLIDPARALRAMLAVLKPRGALLIAQDKSKPTRRAHTNAIWELTTIDGHPILGEIGERARSVNITAACKHAASVKVLNKGSIVFIRIVKPAV